MSKIKGILTHPRGILLVAGALFGLFPLSGLADYEEGVNAAFNGDFETAFYEFTIAAEAGLDLAQYNLGILYFTGQGVEKDLSEAFRWTEAAAQQGHVAAQFNLGSLYYAGDGTEIDRDKAVEMFGLSAKAGHPNAALLLANMFAEGDHVNKDAVQAHAWASVAIRNENLEAVALRESIQSGMSPQQLSQARRLFARWQIE